DRVWLIRERNQKICVRAACGGERHKGLGSHGQRLVRVLRDRLDGGGGLRGNAIPQSSEALKSGSRISMLPRGGAIAELKRVVGGRDGTEGHQPHRYGDGLIRESFGKVASEGILVHRLAVDASEGRGEADELSWVEFRVLQHLRDLRSEPGQLLVGNPFRREE